MHRNYFAAAWQARSHTEQALRQPLPRNVASLALNSPHGRSQHQLHPWLPACRRAAGVGRACRCPGQPLGTAAGAAAWSSVPGRLLPGAELTANPLNLLAYDLAGVGDVGQWSLVVAGREPVQGGPGFILLATRVDPGTGNEASAEELQDHACAVLTGAGASLERVR